MGMSLRRAYSSLNMPPSRYLMWYAVPLVAAGLAVTLILRVLVPFIFEGILGPLLWAIPLYFLVLAILYPYLVGEGKKQEINNNIHFYITHMGVLATSNLPRSEILNLLGQKEEYGALADESRKISTLVDAWNMSLTEAARFIAKRTPSEIFADFLDRFAYALESGEELESFLRNEQLVVINDYAAVYRNNLYELESMKDLFNSMMMSVIFVVIFAILMPIITGISATTLLGGALFLVGFIEIIFLYFTKAKAPPDPMWHNLQFRTRLDEILYKTIPISTILCLVGIVVVLWRTDWPPLITLAAGLTPLAITGIRVGREEEKLKRRDDNFAAFIRSLGASTSARGGQVTETLRHLQTHDFGPLTENVRDLYQRLNLRLDDARAWTYFAADCGSNLIEKFSRMFVEGMRAGGKPAATGRIISDNFVAIVNLRKSRYQTASSFRGLLYGLIAGMAFALYVGLGIVGMLKGIFTDLDMPEGTPFASMFHFEGDQFLVSFLILLLLVAHAMTSALMVKIADGGAYFRAYTDFVIMFWVAAIVGVGSEHAISYLL